jgi:hypothetical protein
MLPRVVRDLSAFRPPKLHYRVSSECVQRTNVMFANTCCIQPQSEVLLSSHVATILFVGGEAVTAFGAIQDYLGYVGSQLNLVQSTSGKLWLATCRTELSVSLLQTL